MYDQNFRNQAVKECVNGQSMAETSRKYNISMTALRGWIKDYKERMVNIKSGLNIIGADEFEKVYENDDQLDDIVKESNVKLTSINIDVDGHNITMSKTDAVKIMEIFYHFDK